MHETSKLLRCRFSDWLSTVFEIFMYIFSCNITFPQLSFHIHKGLHYLCIPMVTPAFSVYIISTFACFDAMLIAINFVNGYIQNGNSFVDVSSGNKKLICNCKLCEFREAKGHMLQQWEKHNLIASIPPIHLSRVNPHNYEILRKMQDYETLNHFHETPYHNICGKFIRRQSPKRIRSSAVEECGMFASSSITD